MGYDDRTRAELLRGLELRVDVDPDQLPDEDDAYYDHQLIGLAVQLQSGEHVGSVSEVIHLPAQDLLAVQREHQGEVLVPFVRDIVPTVDLAHRLLIITPPPGLLDENEAEVIRDSGEGGQDAAV